MKKNKTVCVFCGSSKGTDKEYFSQAKELGKLLVKNDYKLIYGGGKAGIMGAVANGVLENDGKIRGIIPAYLNEREDVYLKLDELDIVSTMVQRKDKMIEVSDSYCVLPGGFGSLDELFEVIVLNQLCQIKTPIVIVNINGFWDNLVKLCDDIFEKEFAKKDHKKLYKVVSNVNEAIDFLNKELA